jgi:phosphatidate phosphatase APP1
MSDWREEIGGLAGAFGWHAREAARAMRRALGAEPYHVVAYRGYGTRDRALVLARVMQDEGIAPADAARARWRNLVDSLRRIECDPLPFARVRASGVAHELVADDEGFVHEWVPLPSPLASSGWHEVELELAAAPGLTTPVRAPARILVPAADAAFGVVSDMDDTVLQSEVTSFLRAARLLLLENARTRLPFPGVAEFYRALEAGTGSSPNPIFYVSSSPWNLYEVIAEFLEAQAIPAGPLLLRDWDLGPGITRNAAHKTTLIREILATYPRLPFILVGDSGQEDPEIYSAIVREHPGRILAIYIRNVTPRPERPAAIRRLAEEVREAGSTLLLVDDTLAAARHAAERGWIR